MTQEAWIVLAMRVALIAGFVSLAGWVALYTWLTGGENWRNPVGRTLVIKSMLVAVTFLVVALGAFFPWFNKHPLITGWIDVALIGGVTPVMCWRSLVWWRLYKAGRLPADGSEEASHE